MAGAPALVSVNNVGVSFFGESRTITVNDGLNIVNFWINVVQDADGNRYGAIEIGTQTWLTENLKTTKFSDRTNIPLVTVDADWNSLTAPAYCYLYNNNEAFGEYYGALYNWYTVDGAISGNKNICPDGWHVPPEKEFKFLIDYCGGQSTAGIKLKAARTRDADGLGLWPTHGEYNQTPTNVSGFSAIPGSGRSVSSFLVAGNNCLMWSATQFEDPGRAEYRRAGV